MLFDLGAPVRGRVRHAVRGCLSEVRDYAIERVEALTHGAQTPTSSKDGALDFVFF
jgi:hypothetical protein